MVSLTIGQYLELKKKIDALQGAQSTLFRLKYKGQYRVISSDTLCTISFQDWDLETDFVNEFGIKGRRARMLNQGGNL